MGHELMDAVLEAAARRDAAIDGAQRSRRGVVHTPAAIARFIVRQVREEVATFVDPACGPGVFLAACVEGLSSPRPLLGLDVDVGAVEQAREALAPFARSPGWSLSFGVGNTLAAPLVHPGRLVILGNPPWAGRSANRRARYTDDLVQEFKRDLDEQPLGERKVGVLSDDYVRFFRWACEQVRRPEGGVVAMVTNGSFLDGLVHRGMRGRFMRWFSEIEIYDLGGSALIARRADRDDNVFGVRTSVAITVARRAPGHVEPRGSSGGLAEVRYVRINGARDDKLNCLEGGRPGRRLRALAPTAPWFRFAPSPAVDPRYLSWPRLPDLMPFHREGAQTNRDAFCIAEDREVLIERLAAFADGEDREWPGRAAVPSRHYDPRRARSALSAAFARDEPAVERIAYRPHDLRWVCVERTVCHRSRPALRAAMRRSEGAVLTVRKDRGEREWAHFGFSRQVVDNCFLSSRSSCRTRAFPTHDASGALNLDRAAAREWLGFRIDPALAWRYVLCVLASPSYRARYDAALRADYPRIPPAPSHEALRGCAEAGERLASAFVEPPFSGGAAPLIIGHRTLHSAALGAAVRGCHEALTAAAILPPAVDARPPASRW